MITNAEESSYEVRQLQRTTTNLIKDSSGSYLAQSETIQQSNKWHPQLLLLRKPFSIRTESNLINDSRVHKNTSPNLRANKYRI
ncbi:hypothetical protein RHMOL_Rhmol08G0189200 [Rhododendron molle]|uniref:Uncharacterized protein n=1 Tax=Rhododendron molle TaxID=49168 RepID=A0ACC0MR20_RHOML|nr:hypothetical protein RHMOL_Rhmol08G0189200 [Rhododendron molle]